MEITKSVTFRGKNGLEVTFCEGGEVKIASPKAEGLRVSPMEVLELIEMLRMTSRKGERLEYQRKKQAIYRAKKKGAGKGRAEPSGNGGLPRGTLEAPPGELAGAAGGVGFVDEPVLTPEEEELKRLESQEGT